MRTFYLYQINDFLQNKNYLKIYRINEIIGNNKVEKEKYIIFTKLYFLLLKLKNYQYLESLIPKLFLNF